MSVPAVSNSGPIAHYACFRKPSAAPSPVVPRVPLLPLLRPPKATAPSHPPRPELAPPPEGFTRTVHAAPAAWPKQLRDSNGKCSRNSTPFGPVPSGEESKEARSARIDTERVTCIKRRFAAKEWDINEAKESTQPAQWLSSERWRRNKPVSGGVTLVFSHANGLQKELWHPMARRLLAQEGSPGAAYGSGAPLPQNIPVVINDIWFIDDPHHGVSQELNAGNLSSVYAWADWGRDILNFVQHVLPAYSSITDAPWQLEWKEQGELVQNLIGVGHSYGGNGLVQASVTRPDAFAALFLIEPMNQPRLGSPLGSPPGSTDNPIVNGALKRRSEWPSVSEAATMRTNAMFAPWDGEVFDLFLSHGLVPSDSSKPNGEVTLATPRWAEAAIFSDPYGPQRGWDKLLDLACPAGLLMAGNAGWMGGPKIAQEIAWRAPRARNERIMDGSHLLVQEKPTEVANALWRFLTTLASGEWDRQRAKL